MKKKTIMNLQNFSIEKSNLKGLAVKGGDCHETVEYQGDHPCTDTYCETINDCQIKCTYQEPC